MSSEHAREPDADEPPFTATGDRVEVRPPTPADIPAYTAAVTLSARRLADFAMPDPHNLPVVIANQSPTYRTFMVHALDAEGSHGLVGRVNVANVVGGSFRNATVGYDSYDPYAGRGLFAEGLRLVLDLLFADPPRGMGLHRVEANIQPANHRSAGLARSIGFVHEGYSRDFLHLPGVDGRRDWRDHERFTMLSTDWPSVPYRAQGHRRVACVVDGPRVPATAGPASLPPSPRSSGCRSSRRPSSRTRPLSSSCSVCLPSAGSSSAGCTGRSCGRASPARASSPPGCLSSRAAPTSPGGTSSATPWRCVPPTREVRRRHTHVVAGPVSGAPSPVWQNGRAVPVRVGPLGWHRTPTPRASAPRADPSRSRRAHY